MSVLISVIGANPESDEYLAALKVKSVLENEFKDSVMGEIVLHANAYITGQDTKDVDVMMMGTLSNYRSYLNFTNTDGKIVEDWVDINSFCTAIEVKSHGRDGIYRVGTEIYAKYRNGDKPVTTQSNKQKDSIFSFFYRSFSGSSPFVTNLILFTGVTQLELKDILTVGEGQIPSNAIGSDFTARDLFQVIVHQGNPYYSNNKYHFNSNGSFAVEKLDAVFQQLTKAQTACGELTRKRIEQITSKSICSSVDDIDMNNMTIYRGRAGTGKTVALIRKAIQLVDEDGARVLILTYNNALVSDIKRLFALADLPDMFQPACVDINTMQSFFYKLINKGLYDGALSGEDYLNKYDDLIEEMCQFLKDDTTKDDLVKILKKDYYLSWDYCFVDEAQDWTESERDILLRLFGSNLLVADGGQQFVRSVEGCDWNVIENRNSIKLKKTLRQENNIITFVNEFIKQVDENASKIQPNDILPGGEIVIQENNFESVITTIKEQLASLKKCGNIPYDMLVFVPHSYVDKESRTFKYKTQFLKNDIDIWDGTNDALRSDYSIAGDEVRVLQYESGRGLEGWSVVCLEFDTFLNDKLKQYQSIEKNASLLESDEDQKRKYILNWLLLPLTRAIDNLIITFKNPDSAIAKNITIIAKNHPEFIKVVR